MALDKLLKRHFWVVIVGLLAIAAFLDAQGMTQIVGDSLALTADERAEQPLVSRMAVTSAAPNPHSPSADAIISRNPFDSVTGPLNAAPIALQDSNVNPPAPDLSNPMAAPDCDGVHVLVIVSSADPDWSFAAFDAPAGGQPGSGKTILRRRGGEVGDKTVTFIGWDRVWLTTATQLCQTQMFKPAAVASSAPATTAPTPPPPAASSGPGGVSADIKNGIQKTGPTEFKVDRGVVDKILENQAELMRQARIVPEQENGKVVGIRLFGVRPDTLLGTLGMENGDRLEKINGFDMTSPESALEAYARLRTADHLTVSVNRQNQEMNLDYKIQ
jgi:general secretion pathway protein C